MAWSRKLKLTLLVGGSLLGIAACLAIAHFRRGGNVHPNDSGYFAIQSWRDYRDLRGLLWLQKNGAKKGTPADQAKAALGLPNEVRRRSIDREDWVYIAVDMRTRAQTHWAVRIEDRRVVKWFMTAPVRPPARTEKYVPSEFTGHVPAAKFYEGRSAIHRRVIGVLMTASVGATSRTITLTWTLDYDGPRPPLTILKPSLENGNHGQTFVLVYAEGKYGGAFEQRLISPSAAGKYWSSKKWFATIKKGEHASGKITISVPKARDYFRRYWPKHFDGTTPKLHVQLVHKPWDRGEQHGFDAWTGELHSKVLEVPQLRVGLEIDGKRVQSIPGLDLRPGSISAPKEADKACAQKLPAHIGPLGLKYLKQQAPQRKYALFAARQVGDYVLLCYTWQTGEDGDAFLVYSTKERRVLGTFCWYVQG